MYLSGREEGRMEVPGHRVRRTGMGKGYTIRKGCCRTKQGRAMERVLQNKW